MKKALVVIMAFCFMAGWSAAVLVDNFDSYATGLVTTVTTNWKTFLTNGAVNIAIDPTNPGNKVLDFLEDGASGGGYGILTGDAIVANGTTKTLFFRCRTTTGMPNSIIGLTDIDAPAVNSWGAVGNVCRVIDGTIQTCLTGTPTWDTAKTMPGDTWYNVWVVTIHNTAGVNTYKVYMNSTPGANGNATTDHVGTITPSPFRTSASNALSLDRIMFISYARSPAAHILFDDINIMNGETLINPVLPLGAHNPTPADGASNVPLNQVLSWSTGVDPTNPANPNPAITKHYVTFAKNDPNLGSGATRADISPASVTSWTPPSTGTNAMALDGTYYWRVDESVNGSSRTDPNTIKGVVWSFTAEKSIPVITTQPVSVRVSKDTTTSFSTVFTSVYTPVTVVWKKNGAFYANGTYTGTNPYTTTLTFGKVADSDQAEYTCELNKVGQTTPTVSNTVTLVTKKLLAHYEFENNLNDSSSYGPHNGTGKSVADPNFTAGLTYGTGLVGNAVVFNGSAFVDLGTDAYPKTGLGNGMDEATISCWVKATQIGGLITNYNNNILAGAGGNPLQLAANTTGFGMALAGTSDGRVHLRGEVSTGTPPVISESFMGAAQGAPVKTPPFNMMNDGLWHQVAATWKAGAQMIVYVDGVQVASTTALTPASYAAWQRGVVLGGIRAIADRSRVGELYLGMMDDLQVYNYVRTAHEIADIYYAASGKGVCTEMSKYTYDFNKYDLNGNCKIDFGDFAELAARWLDCGFYPTSTCLQ